MKMFARSFGDLDMYLALDMYPTTDIRQMITIDVDYNARVGYWASRNNVQEYKVYATMNTNVRTKFCEQLVTSFWG